jgi:transcription antitermination factor NusB
MPPGKLDMGIRRKARECALQILFQLDFDRDDIPQKIERFWQEHKHTDSVRQFAEILVNGTLENLTKIDDVISKCALNWRLGRMASVDRNILRFATYEILYRDDIPDKVSINEALEIAKKFSTEESCAFINGILDKIAHSNDYHRL